MRTAVQLVRGSPARLLAAAGLAAGMVLAGVGLLATSGYLVARAALHPETVLSLMVAATGVRFFGLTRAALRYLERLVSHDMTLRLVAALRRRLYASLLPRVPLGSGGQRSADLLGRLLEDVDELQNVPLKLLAPALSALLVATVSVGLVALVSPAAALVTTGLLVLAGGVLPALVGAAGGRLGARESALRARRRVLLLDSLQGAQELRLFGQRGAYRARLEALDHNLLRLAEVRGGIEGVRDGAAALLALAGPWAVLVSVLPAVSAGRVAPLALLPLTLGVAGAFEALVPLAEAAERRGRIRAAAERIAEVIGRAPAVPATGTAPLPTSRDLAFSGVGFGYGGAAALDGVSLTLEPGRRLAVVGPSGAGKSTLIRLAVRFADPERGRVTLGGQELPTLSQDAVRSQMAVVPQQAQLFPTTVRANLTLALSGASDTALWEALRQAQLAGVIEALPAGLDTVLGEYGARLSAGERQRLAIARALLKPAPLLLLDEPTAHLDALTERRLLGTLLAPSARGVLLVTHRLVGLEAVDEVIVLDRGRVVQRGRHRTLVAATGLYRRLWQAQRGELVEAATSDGCLPAPVGRAG